MAKSELERGDDPFDLKRFVDAQKGAYARALKEIRSGRKSSHWMWFIFPQIEGLGHSPTARRYSIKSADEVRAYLAHPVLGPRLIECTEAVLAAEGLSASAIFGHPDTMKLRSCMTLFRAVSDSPSVFDQVLEQFYDGQGDGITPRLMKRGSGPSNPQRDPR